MSTETFFCPPSFHNQQSPASSVPTSVRVGFPNVDGSASCNEVGAPNRLGDIQSVEETESRRHVTPASDGRAVRTTATEDAVLLDILSTRGNSIEGVWLDRAQLLGLIGILREAQREADELLEKGTAQRRVESDQSYREALARNPWLTGKNDKLHEERY